MLTPEPTAGLLLAVGRGDRDALAALYREVAPHLFALAVRITRQASIAEEVVQDVFVAVARKAQSYDPSRGTATAWLATITRHPALDRAAGRQRSRRLRAAGRDRGRPAPADLPRGTARDPTARHRAGVFRRRDPRGGRGTPGEPARHGQELGAARVDPAARLSRP